MISRARRAARAAPSTIIKAPSFPPGVWRMAEKQKPQQQNRGAEWFLGTLRPHTPTHTPSFVSPSSSVCTTPGPFSLLTPPLFWRGGGLWFHPSKKKGEGLIDQSHTGVGVLFVLHALHHVPYHPKKAERARGAKRQRGSTTQRWRDDNSDRGNALQARRLLYYARDKAKVGFCWWAAWNTKILATRKEGERERENFAQHSKRPFSPFKKTRLPSPPFKQH